jgi:hypothetical protein
MSTESELLVALRGPFLDLAQAVIRECPDCPPRLECVSRLLDAQDAAGRAARWSPPQQQAVPKPLPLVDDQARAQRRAAASEAPRRMK